MAACSSNPSEQISENNLSDLNAAPDSIVVDTFGNLLKEAGFKGSILILNEDNNAFYSNDFHWSKKSALPASTFKLPNTLVLLQSGAASSLKETIPYYGEKRAFGFWEEEMSFGEAFRRSCFPCYSQITKKLSASKMRHYLGLLNYPGMVFDSTDYFNFWVQGDSKINQFQQIDFLKQLADEKLKVDVKNQTLLKSAMLDTGGRYPIYGKTGWTRKNGKEIGWYVGWVKHLGNRYYVATRIEAEGDFDLKSFIAIRKKSSEAVLHQVIESN